VRARETFQQFRVLHPRLGPSPWNERIADLFGEPLPGSTPKESAP